MKYSTNKVHEYGFIPSYHYPFYTRRNRQNSLQTTNNEQKQMKENPQLQLAYNFLHYTGRHIFLTGKAGTGKTTFLKNLKKSSPKRMVVVAPTGVAAINAGGVTIHSFFQLPFGPQIPQDAIKSGIASPRAESVNRFTKNKINLIRSLDLLVIDEISMVRADVLDAIDATMRRFKNRYQPFGGVQLLMIGDLQQLAPVVKEEDWEILGKYYDTCFFFSSHALKKSEYISIELKHIYRQSEQDFIDLLNKVRDNRMETADLEKLNSRFTPNFSPDDNEGYITLTTHNYQAKQINDSRLQKLTTRLHRFSCTVEGEFPEYAYPADETLELKTGAQVMFLKNDTSYEKRYYNGKIGKVTDIDDEQIEVLCPGETEPIVVEKAIWENTRYRLNEQTNEIEEEMIGKFIQYPLKQAWAITIHKSQGLTFEKAIIDAHQSFAHGQVYVALSRCKSFEGLVLRTPLNSQSVINDNTVTGFIDRVEANQPGEAELNKHRKEYEWQLLNELIDFKPISRTLSYLLKTWDENAGSLMGNMPEILKILQKPIQEELIDVADKFRLQMEKLTNLPVSAEENNALQERLIKGAAYFLAKIGERVETPLEEAGFETDNREVLNRISEIYNRLEMELEIKKACLNSVAEGFSIKKYLEARAVASIEKPTAKSRSMAVSANVKNPDFYRKLVQWRQQKAMETGLEIPRILSQKVMAGIADQLPVSAVALKAVKGMGGKKMEQFGQDILSLILTWRNEKGMAVPENASEEVLFAGLSTKEISFELFKKSGSVKQVARLRKFAETTVEGHLAHFIRNGELDIARVVPAERIRLISSFIKENPGVTNSTEIRKRLGETVSYGEIRLVLASLFL